MDPGTLLAAPAMAWLSECAREAVVEAVGRGAGGEVRVRVVGDAEMSALHLRTHGDATPTDVLTFDLRSTPGAGEPLDTDIVVCVDEAARQGRERGHAVERELLLYIVHGVLHCLGHDDHDEAAFAAMHAEEDRILEAIGVGATFARDEGHAGEAVVGEPVGLHGGRGG